MEPYKDFSRNSGVLAYECGSDFIRVEFKNSSIYLYTYTSTGGANIEQMKRLAHAGEGLATFINENVRERFARHER